MKFEKINESTETDYGFKNLLYIIVDGEMDTELENSLRVIEDFHFDFTYDINTDLSYLQTNLEDKTQEFNQLVSVMKDKGFVQDKSVLDKLENRKIKVEYGGKESDGYATWYEEVNITIPGIDESNLADEWESSIPYPEFIKLNQEAMLEDEGFLLESEESLEYFEELIKQDNVESIELY